MRNCQDNSLIMITYTYGNLLESEAEALVNTVNTVGVMGKGIALQFKKAFPANFLKYSEACRSRKLISGTLLVTRENNSRGQEKIIINFPTKQHWRYPSKYEYIHSGLTELVKIINAHKIKSIAIPPLGCGNGGLQWHIVKPMIENALKEINCNIIIYEPSTHSAASHEYQQLQLFNDSY